jgi:hypothetical protein
MPKFFTYQRPKGPTGKGAPNARFGAPIPGRKEPKATRKAAAPALPANVLPPRKD